MHIIMLTQLEATIGRQQAEELLLTIADCLTLATALTPAPASRAVEETLAALRTGLREAETLADGLRAILEG